MPLARVVDYLNDRLHELHPHARLRDEARFALADGSLHAEIADCRLTPYQVPVVDAGDSRVFGYCGRYVAVGATGRRLSPKSLYGRAREAADVVFLDRFVRTFYALQHLNQGRDADERLIAPVHLRHLSAVPEQHGLVFEDLIARLGLSPSQVVLRIDGPALHQDPHVRSAAASFVRRGYRLAATRIDPWAVDWALLEELGVRWVTPSLAAVHELNRHGLLGNWTRRARARRIPVWLPEAPATTPLPLDDARNVGIELVERAASPAEAELAVAL